jgi:curved DNA-binding protein CbpA
VRRDAPPEGIKENYHLLMALLHPDRREGAGKAWPDACAQRVNLAYDALGGERARREYDVRLRSVQRPSRAPARGPVNEMRFAKAVLGVGAVMVALIAATLLVDDDEWSDRSVLQASLARWRTQPMAGSERPRYVSAGAASSARARDAVYDAPEPFALLKPILDLFRSDEAKAWAPTPALEAATSASAESANALPLAAVAEPVLVAQAAPERIAPAPQPAASNTPFPPVAAAKASSPVVAAAKSTETSRTTNREIEDLVVKLVDSYQAGDTERLVGLLEPDAGFWRTVQMRNAYSDFFRATRARRLRIENLAWSVQPSGAQAKGEATIVAEYPGEAAAVERRVPMELDLVMREGEARIRRISLYPGPR